MAAYNALKSYYPLIRETYKHCAGLQPSGNIMSLGMNVITDIMLQCNGFVDYRAIKLSDVDLAAIAINALGSKKFPYHDQKSINPDR